MISVRCDDIHCRMFRHAAYKSDDDPIDQHASKLTCDALKTSDEVYGGAKPYEMIHDGTAPPIGAMIDKHVSQTSRMQLIPFF